MCMRAGLTYLAAEAGKINAAAEQLDKPIAVLQEFVPPRTQNVSERNPWAGPPIDLKRPIQKHSNRVLANLQACLS